MKRLKLERGNAWTNLPCAANRNNGCWAPSRTASGRRSYGSYLKWLSSDAGAQKDMAFKKMCRGWALGSREFKKELLKSEGLLKDGDFEALRMEGRDLAEANELLWEALLERGLRAA